MEISVLKEEFHNLVLKKMKFVITMQIEITMQTVLTNPFCAHDTCDFSVINVWGI